MSEVELFYFIRNDGLVVMARNEPDPHDDFEQVQRDEYEAALAKIVEEGRKAEIAMREQFRAAKVAELVATGLPQSAAEILAGPPATTFPPVDPAPPTKEKAKR